MLPPLPRCGGGAWSSLVRPTVSAFPDTTVRSARTLSFSRFAQRSLTLRPAHSRCHQFVTRFTRRLRPFRYLHDRSGCFRLERFSRVGLSPTGKTPPLHGARRLRTFRFRSDPVRSKGASGSECGLLKNGKAMCAPLTEFDNRRVVILPRIGHMEGLWLRYGKVR